jgi:histidine ammonia-lyase
VLADRHVTKLLEAPASSQHDRARVSPGLAGLGFVAASFNEQARDAARRTLLPVSEGGGYLGQNDVAAPAFLAYRRERRAAECLDASLAILAVAASEILHLGHRAPAAGARSLLDGVRLACPPGDTDADALQALARRIESCALTGEGLAP